LKEGLMISFYYDLIKRKLPLELYNRKPILTTKVLENLHNDANGILEKVVIDELNNRGFIGRRNIKSRTLKSSDGIKIDIPSDVGEIDVLCLHPGNRVLIIGECKNVSFSPEPIHWYEDLQDFGVIESKPDSYKSKFLRKINWCLNNANLLIKAILKENSIHDYFAEWIVLPLFITTFESVAVNFIEDFPCSSLPRFLSEYDANGLQTYDQWKRNINI
ncbi:hypothetical protein GTO91_17585, partial [Heliobacterium undosum]